jgi:3' exoribonuclease, RNase T-like
MSRIDVMVDIETLGTSSDATIFQIAAISFDIRTGDILDNFNGIADISVEDNLKVDGSTLKWWLNTDKELLAHLLNNGDGSPTELLQDFHTWLTQQTPVSSDLFLWGNGILFDNKMIQQQLEDIGLFYPINYKNDRDVRTIVDLAGAKLGLSEKELKDQYNDESLVHHNAFDDVLYQVRLVTGCYNALIK